MCVCCVEKNSVEKNLLELLKSCCTSDIYRCIWKLCLKAVVVMKHCNPPPLCVLPAVAPLEELHDLPKEARIIFRGSSAADFATREGKEALRQADVILNTSWVGKVERNLLRSVWPQLQENLKWM